MRHLFGTCAGGCYADSCGQVKSCLHATILVPSFSKGGLGRILKQHGWMCQLKRHPNAPNPLQLWLYGSFRDSRKLTLRVQTIRLSNAPFRLELQYFGHSRFLYVPVQLFFLVLLISRPKRNILISILIHYNYHCTVNTQTKFSVTKELPCPHRR